MKNKSMTANTPLYRVEGVNGEYFNVFAKRDKAIKSAISMAVEYPGTKFLVVETSFISKKIIFSYQVDKTFSFDDLQNVYRGIIEVYQKKLNKTKFWRKPDVV